MVKENASGTEIYEATFTDVSSYGGTEQIGQNFGKLL